MEFKKYWIDAEPISDPHPHNPIYNTYLAQSHEPCVEERCEKQYICVIAESEYLKLKQELDALKKEIKEE